MVHYDQVDNSMGKYPLKIEFSLRQTGETQESDSTIINGIRVYKIDELAKKKFGAFMNREKIRDIYDVAFLLQNYPDTFTQDMLREIKKKNPDVLCTIFEGNKKDDVILSNVDGTELVLGIYDKVDRLLQQ
jgi:predicted nucleotidyltransferase component of viral defense system